MLNNKKQVKGKALSIWYVVIILIFMLLSFGFGMCFGQRMIKTKNTDTKKDNQKENVLPTEKEKKDSEILPVEINDEIISLYNKYHSSSNPTELSPWIEEEIYMSDVYELKEDTGISFTYIYKIMDIAKSKLPINGNDDLKKIIKESYKDFFGDKYSSLYDSYENNEFKCLEILYENGELKPDLRCGGTSEEKVKFSLVKAEKDSNNMYLYEDVVIFKNDNEVLNNYKYKWTYDLQDDGNYYFVKAERIS